MKTLILGFDAFDPAVFERLYEKGSLPNLAKYVDTKGYARFSVSNPPQSEVSWTSIATGLNPGGHGIFDFVHRNPASYSTSVSLLPTKRGIGGVTFVPPHKASTIFDQTVRNGYPATSLWWPATFPAQPGSPVRTIPGLGTPDVQGRLGVGTLFTTDSGLVEENLKTRVERFTEEGDKRYSGNLIGPIRRKRNGIQESAIELQMEIIDENAVRLSIGGQNLELEEGKWSPIIELAFKVGFLYSVRVLTRVALTSLKPEIKLYFLPLQLHPLRSPWQYATPAGFIKQTWQRCGPFLTIGWPQETTGLEEACFTDSQFLALCESIHQTREKILMHHLQYFNEGLFASIFDSLDRIQHMFWRDRPDIIESWYKKLDGLVGRVEDQLESTHSKRAHIVILSDHGFSDFHYKVHVNRWLIEKGFLNPLEENGKGTLQQVDWERSQAYAIGLNSIYLNRKGREGKGIVGADQVMALVNQLRDQLLSWKGPDGNQVVSQVRYSEEALEGPLASFGPDILVGFSPGYRASSQTGLGEWVFGDALEPNQDHWGGDHCIDPEAVPGVLFSNQGLDNYPDPSYLDIPALTIRQDIDHKNVEPPTYSDEDQEVVEERLRSLGYL